MQTPYFWFDTLTLEEFHSLSTYLSSRCRAAGYYYCQNILAMEEEMRVAFLKHLYSEAVSDRQHGASFMI
jgi:hypothetical protein